MTAPAASPAVSAQLSQAGLAAVVAAQVSPMLRHLDTSDLAASRGRLTVLLHSLVQRYGPAAATLAARQYALARNAAGLGTFTIRPAAPAPLEQVGSAVGWAISGLYGPQPDVQAFSTKLTGAAEKLVLDTGRATILDNVGLDRAAKGWARIPEARPCAFCALLATRGAVYKHNTVGFRSHDHCRCHAEPVFTAYEPTAQIREWQRLYRDSTTGGNSARTRRDWRAAFDATYHA